MERNYPEIVISNEGVTWLDKGQMWMYKNNLEQCDPNIKNGELVDIVTRDGRYLGTGFISLESHITVRILSKNQNEIIDRQFFKIEYNKPMILEKLLKEIIYLIVV